LHTKRLKPFAISPQQFNILRILRGRYPEPATINVLQERMLDKMSNASRLAVIPLIITMLLAGFIVHAPDPYVKKELAFLYLLPFIFLFLSGAGRYSLDGMILNMLNKN
jgi:hypothetical protein